MHRLVLSVLAVALCLGLLLPLTLGKSITARHQPPVTTEGSFVGTWYHVSVGLKLAFFIREGDQGLEVKLRWEAASGLRFETGWDGAARYSTRGFPGSVSLDVDPTESDANVIRGSYERILELEKGDYQKEGGPFRIERTYHGNSLVWSFHPYTREERKAGRLNSGTHEDIFFELRKATFRIIAFEDIPW